METGHFIYSINGFCMQFLLWPSEGVCSTSEVLVIHFLHSLLDKLGADKKNQFNIICLGHLVFDIGKKFQYQHQDRFT